MISSANTSPTLTNPDRENGGIWQPGYYRTIYNDRLLGPFAAKYMFESLRGRTLATIHDGSPYAFKLQKLAAEEFVKVGGQVTLQGAVNVGDFDVVPLLTEIATKSPDVLFYPVFLPELSQITGQAKEVAGLEDTVLMAGDILLESFVASTGIEDSHGVLAPKPSDRRSPVRGILEKVEGNAWRVATFSFSCAGLRCYVSLVKCHQVHS